MDHRLLKDKNLIILGGTGGIGLAAAKLFVEHGASVLITGRNMQDGDEAKDIIPGVRVLIQDSTEENSAEKAFEICTNHFGRVDGLYHVAGGSGRMFGDGPLHDLSLEGWDMTLNMNARAIMLSNRAAIRYWLKHDMSGTILNIGSILGESPSAMYFHTHAYAAAKAASIGFTKAIAAYYAPHNIRVNILSPALVATAMSARSQNNEEIMHFIKTKQPLDGGRIGDPSDCAGLALYFMSDLSKFTTGQIVHVDGGWAISDGQWG